MVNSTSKTPESLSRLVVITPGLWGALWNVEYMRDRLQRAGGDATLVYSAVSNLMLNSYNGIDLCGMRLAAEVRSLFEERRDLDQVRSVSFIGYSAGGLFVRYAVGVLYEEEWFSTKGVTLDKIIMLATPNLSMRVCRPSFLGRVRNGVLSSVANLYGGPTLEQMTLIDKGPDGRALMLQMTQPGTPFTKALKASQGVYFYANALGDHTIPYCSAALAAVNPYESMDPRDIPAIPGFPVIAGVHRVCDDEDIKVVDDTSVEKDKATARIEGATPEGGKRKGVLAANMGEVGLAAIFVVCVPVLAVHFLLLILPLRIAQVATAGDARAVAENSSSINTKNVKGRDREASNASPDGQQEAKSQHVSAQDDSVGSKDGKDQSSETSEDSMDAISALMRQNLARPELEIQRVDVCLHHTHTHGSIVVRRSYVSEEGKIVIDHMASLLFPSEGHK